MKVANAKLYSVLVKAWMPCFIDLIFDRQSFVINIKYSASDKDYKRVSGLVIHSRPVRDPTFSQECNMNKFQTSIYKSLIMERQRS